MAEQRRQRIATDARAGGKRDGREEVRARGTDVSVGAQQVMLGFLNVRATQQRAGADACRDQRDGVIAQALQRTRQQVVWHRVARQQIKGVFVL